MEKKQSFSAIPKHDLTVTLVQSDIVWEDPAANRAQMEQLLKNNAPINSDLILLPEMFTTGFTMNAAQLAEPAEGPTLAWMRDMAHAFKAAFAGTVMVKSGHRFLNRLYWVTPAGHYAHYDKRHLFRMANEHNVYSQGREKVIIVWRGWRFLPLICYDLRFAVWSSNQGLDYDVLLYLANWPQRRIDHWRWLLKARAIENQSYVIGVNRIGKDGDGIEFSGSSQVYTPLGQKVVDLAQEQRVFTVTLSAQELTRFRQKFPVWKDQDRYIIPDTERKIHEFVE